MIYNYNPFKEDKLCFVIVIHILKTLLNLLSIFMDIVNRCCKIFVI